MLYSQLYHDYAKKRNYSRPDIVVAFNSGLQRNSLPLGTHRQISDLQKPAFRVHQLQCPWSTRRCLSSEEHGSYVDLVWRTKQVEWREGALWLFHGGAILVWEWVCRGILRIGIMWKGAFDKSGCFWLLLTVTSRHEIKTYSTLGFLEQWQQHA